jgi:hypothetical protein
LLILKQSPIYYALKRTYIKKNKSFPAEWPMFVLHILHYQIEINYSDKSGRVLEPKEAFRVLSWKFHGKGPGKKQAEKHTMKVVKREKLKKMNSQDTPLGWFLKGDFYGKMGQLALQ